METINAVVGIAELLAREDQVVQALELLVYVHQHPAADWEAREKAKRLLNTLTRTLSNETITQATVQAKILNLNLVVDSLLAEHQVVSSDIEPLATNLLNKYKLSDKEKTPPTSPATSKDILTINRTLSEPLNHARIRGAKIDS